MFRPVRTPPSYFIDITMKTSDHITKHTHTKKIQEKNLSVSPKGLCLLYQRRGQGGGNGWCVGAEECNGVRCNSDGDECDGV